MKIFDAVDTAARKISKWMSHIACILVLALIGVICADVIARYVFNSPISWAYEMSYIFGAFIAATGIGQLMLDDGNVRVDLFSVKFSEKTRLWVESIFSVCVFFPAYVMLTRSVIKNCIAAYASGETSVITTWYPKLWPIKLVLCIGLVVFLLDYLLIIIRKIIQLVNAYKKTDKEAAK